MTYGACQTSGGAPQRRCTSGLAVQHTSLHVRLVAFSQKNRILYVSFYIRGIFLKKKIGIIQRTYQQICLFADPARAFQPGKRTGAPGDLGASP